MRGAFDDGQTTSRRRDGRFDAVTGSVPDSAIRVGRGSVAEPPSRSSHTLRLLVLALGLAITAAVVAPADAQVQELRAAEGEWVGAISFTGADIPFSGTFQFNSSGGALDGTFQWAGATTQLSGSIEGPDNMPRFVMTRVVSNGVEIPDVSGGGEVQFTLATCERLEGIGVNLQTTAPISDTVWWAMRAGVAEDPTEFFAALEVLQSEVTRLIDDLDKERIILSGVFDLLEVAMAEAESLAADLDRAVGCGLDFYRSVIAAEVTRLLDFALANPDISVFSLAQVLLSATRAGVIGSGAEAIDVALDAAAQAVVADRIARAVADSDPIELELLALLSEDLGWSDLAEAARAALEALS